MRELGVISNESGLGDTFNEIDELQINANTKTALILLKQAAQFLKLLEGERFLLNVIITI
jgi:hypothetical protein